MSLLPPAQGLVARVISRVIFWTLLILLVLIAIPYGSVEPWWEAVFECVVFGLTALWVIEGLLSGGWHVRGYSLLAPLAAIILFAFLQTLPLWGTEHSSIQTGRWQTLSADPFETRLFVLNMLALVLFGLLFLRYTSSERRLRTLVYVIICGGVANALFGLMRQVLHHDSSGFVLQYLAPGTGYGQFINRNHFAFPMEMVLGLQLGLVAYGGVQRKHLLIVAATILPVWTALIMANSRGGIFSMFCQLILIALLLSARRNPQQLFMPGAGRIDKLWNIGRSFVVRIVLVACLIAVVLAGTLWLGGAPLLSRLETVPGEVAAKESDTSERGGRMDVWRATWRLIKDNPVYGVGFGGYWVAIPAYHDASGEHALKQAHNDYLELLASGGLIGAALAAWFIVAFLKRARRCLTTSDKFRRAACCGALIGLFGVAVHSSVEFGLHITSNAVLFAALVVIATVDIHSKEQST